MAVLCRAEDGRVAIEAANGDDCAKSPACHPAEHSDAHSENEISSRDDCGDCVDFPRSIGSALALKKAFKPLGFPTLSFVDSAGADDQTAAAIALLCKYSGM